MNNEQPWGARMDIKFINQLVEISVEASRAAQHEVELRTHSLPNLICASDADQCMACLEQVIAEQAAVDGEVLATTPADQQERTRECLSKLRGDTIAADYLRRLAGCTHDTAARTTQREH